MFRLLKAVFVGIKVARDMPKRADAQASAAMELARYSIGDLLALRDKLSVDATPYAYGPTAEGSDAPAPPEAIEEVAQRLSQPLPAPLLELYSYRNGLRLNSSFLLSHVLPVQELRFGNGYFPSLASRCEKDWQQWGASRGEVRALRVSSPTWKGLLAADVVAEVPFTAVDDFLVISAHERRPRTIILQKAMDSFPVGTVMSIENLRAVVYSSLAHYIAYDVAGEMLEGA